MDKYVVFEEYDTDNLQSSTTISNCFSIDTCDTKSFCKKDDNENNNENNNENSNKKCLLKIPKNKKIR